MCVRVCAYAGRRERACGRRRVGVRVCAHVHMHVYGCVHVHVSPGYGARPATDAGAAGHKKARDSLQAEPGLKVEEAFIHQSRFYYITALTRDARNLTGTGRKKILL